LKGQKNVSVTIKPEEGIKKMGFTIKRLKKSQKMDKLHESYRKNLKEPHAYLAEVKWRSSSDLGQSSCTICN